MSVDMFNSRSGVDENSTPDNMFDITLGGTNWQGGLNAKEPVCPAAFVDFFMLLRVYALRCNASQCFLLLVCAAAKACPVVCQCHAVRAVLLRALLGRLKLLQGQQCMCLLLCLCNIYIQVVPYVPVPDTAW